MFIISLLNSDDEAPIVRATLTPKDPRDSITPNLPRQRGRRTRSAPHLTPKGHEASGNEENEKMDDSCDDDGNETWLFYHFLRE